jgi:predicted ATP-dependent serine protease
MEYRRRNYPKQEKRHGKKRTTTSKAARPLRINEIDSTQERMDTTDAATNWVLGGIVPGSHTFRRRARNREKYFITTNILEIAIQTLYVSGEESQKQIKNAKESPILATTVIFLQKKKTRKNAQSTPDNFLVTYMTES